MQIDTDLWNYLKNQTKAGRPVVLYGTGDGADKIMAVLEERGIPVSGIFASPGFVRDGLLRALRQEHDRAHVFRLLAPGSARLR